MKSKLLTKFLGISLSILFLAFMLTACTGGTEDAKTEPNTDEGDETAPSSALVIGMITDQFGSQSYSDDVLAGLEKVAEKYGCTIIPIEMGSGNIASAADSLRTLISQGATLLVVPAPSYHDAMQEVAEENPDIKFLYPCEAIEGGKNIMSFEYRENEGAFLAGALAGLLTQSNNVGAVMAESDPVQQRYQYGYMAGAKMVNPDCVVQTAFTNSYADVNKGAEVASVMYGKGADFVGCYAGACNLGVFNAAKEAGEGKYCFGAANGQFDKMPDKIIASVVKPIDEAIQTILGQYIETGAFDTDKPYSLGLKEDGMVLRFTSEQTLLNAVVPTEVRDKIDDIISKVESGEIVVPGTEETYQQFTYVYPQ